MTQMTYFRNEQNVFYAVTTVLYAQSMAQFNISQKVPSGPLFTKTCDIGAIIIY